MDNQKSLQQQKKEESLVVAVGRKTSPGGHEMVSYLIRHKVSKAVQSKHT